jgi:hypothetical protein
MDNPFDGIDADSKVSENVPKVNIPKLPKIIFPKIKVQPSDEDIENKSSLIFKIQSYGKNKRFGKKLRHAKHNFTSGYLQKKTIDELKLELESIDMTLSDGQNSDFIDNGLKYGLSIVETVISGKTIFQINGTTEKCFLDEHFLDLLERVKYKYGIGSMKLDPLMELILFVGQTALVIHQTNKLLAKSNININLDEEVEE